MSSSYDTSLKALREQYGALSAYPSTNKATLTSIRDAITKLEVMKAMNDHPKIINK